MPLPLVVEYLRTHSLAELREAHGVRAGALAVGGHKVSLNYDQLAARDADALACECRGLVLATPDGSPFPLTGPCGDLEVLAWPMDRFFNLGAGAAHVVDDATLGHEEARVYEKLDGTLCIVYYDSLAPNEGELGDPANPRSYGMWCVATRSVPDADRPIDGFADHTFGSLFRHSVWCVTNKTWAEFSRQLARGHTYCFELCSPRAGSGVVRYGVDQPCLLAVRATRPIDCGRELDPDRIAQLIDVAPAPTHALGTLAALHDAVESRPPSEHEGVVVRLPGRAPNGGFLRVKVKSAAYVAAHGLSSGAVASPRNLLRAVVSGQWDDVRVMVRPDLRDRGDALAGALRTWCISADVTHRRLFEEHGADRKAYALAVQAAGLPIGVMMSMWTGKVRSASEFIAGCSDPALDALAGWIGAPALVAGTEVSPCD